MRKVWIIARNDLQMTLRNKQNWVLLLALPGLIIYLAGLGAQGIARVIPTSIRIDVLDQDDTATSNAFTAALSEANETLLICPADEDPADACALAGTLLSPALARERLVGEVTFATITIPEGFASALEKGADVTVGFQPGEALAAPEIAFLALQSVVTELGGPIVATRLSTQMAESLGIETGPDLYAARLEDTTATWAAAPPIRTTAESTQSGEGQIMAAQVVENGFKLSTPGITVMFVMVSILGLTQSLAEERMMGILQRVGMMPISRSQLLGGKLLSTYLLGLLQFAVLLVFGVLLGVGFGNAPSAVILVAGSYTLAITAMALALATLARTPQQASGIATFAYMVLAPLGGAWWPLAVVPGWMRALGHLSPVAWCLDALNALVMFQGTVADVLQPAGVLLLFAVALFVFGVKKLDYHQPASHHGTRAVPYFGTQGRR